MYAPDQDYQNAPYRLLIRARSQAQFEQAVLAIVNRIAATAVSVRVAEKLAPAMTNTVAGVILRKSSAVQALPASSVMTALHALSDYDDWCGTPWPRPWPWPWPWPEKPQPDPWRDLGYLDMIGLKTINSLARLITTEVGKKLVESSQSLMEDLAV